MILFDANIKDILLGYISSNPQYVESIQLASYGFNITFTDFSIHCSERVIGFLNNVRYEWDDAPSSAPWGAFGRQKAVSVSIPVPYFLRITFESGDYLEIETCESEYESVVFNFPPVDDGIVMEIY